MANRLELATGLSPSWELAVVGGPLWPVYLVSTSGRILKLRSGELCCAEVEEEDTLMSGSPSLERNSIGSVGLLELIELLALCMLAPMTPSWAEKFVGEVATVPVDPIMERLLAVEDLPLSW